jgi:hypothetical protein
LNLDDNVVQKEGGEGGAVEDEAAEAGDSTSTSTSSAATNPFAKPAETNPFAKPAETNPFAKPAETNPFAAQSSPESRAVQSQADADAQMAYKREVMAIYTKYNPSRVGDVDIIMQQWRGKEGELVMELEKKYGKVPTANEPKRSSFNEPKRSSFASRLMKS